MLGRRESLVFIVVILLLKHLPFNRKLWDKAQITAKKLSRSIKIALEGSKCCHRCWMPSTVRSVFAELREIRSKESTEREISLSKNISKETDYEVVLQLESLTNEIKTHWSGRQHNCLGRKKNNVSKEIRLRRRGTTWSPWSMQENDQI